METLNINKIIFFLTVIILFNCNKDDSFTSLKLSRFNKKIWFEGYTEKLLENAEVKYISNNVKKTGKLTITKLNDSLFYGKVNFENISDLVKKQDTLLLIINKANYFITDIVNRKVKSNGSAKSNFIELKLNDKEYKMSDRVIIKE